MDYSDVVYSVTTSAHMSISLLNAVTIFAGCVEDRSFEIIDSQDL